MLRPGMAVHVFPTNIVYGSRIARMTQYAVRQNIFSAVEVVGILEPGLPRVENTTDGRTIRRFDIGFALRNRSRFARLISFLLWYVTVLLHYRNRDVSCISAHTSSVLPLCWLIAKLRRSVLIYEPHELESETASARGFTKWVILFIERIFGKSAAAVICSNFGISEWYQTTFGLSDIWTVRNLPSSSAYDPLPQHYYANRFGFTPSDYVFLYQGILSANRGIELMIDAFRKLPRDRHLVLLGFGPLEAAVIEAAREIPNVHFHPAVSPTELLSFTAAADAGIMMIAPVSISYYFCYPNKYCECLSVGKPVICTESLWLNAEVQQYRCGWSVPYQVDALVETLREINRDALNERGEGAAAWARKNTWQSEERELASMYEAVFPQLAKRCV